MNTLCAPLNHKLAMADSDVNWRRRETDPSEQPTSLFLQQCALPKDHVPEKKDDCCDTYATFKKTLDGMRECFQCLNPLNGDVCGPRGPLNVKDSIDRANGAMESVPDIKSHPYAMEFIRGGIVRILALWEGFVKDVLHEYFTKEFLSCKDLKEVKAKWPRCETAIQNAIEAKARKLTKKAQANDRDLPWKKVVFDALLDEKGWKILLEEHLERCLEKMNAPIFDIPKPEKQKKETSGDAQKSACGELEDGIDATFRNLFLPKNTWSISISQQIIDSGISYYCRTGRDKYDKYEVHLKKVEQLWNVTRLYYGVRGVFAHGDPQKTLNNSLKNFPKDPNQLLEPLGNNTQNYAGDLLLGLYNRLCQFRHEKRQADVSYLTWINMNRFFEKTAEKLYWSLADYCSGLQSSAEH